MSSKYLKPREASALAGVNTATLRRWEEEGKVKVNREISGHRRYDRDSILQAINSSEYVAPLNKVNVCYARVSTYSQKQDLQRQIDIFSVEFPDYEIIKDIGSGLNYKRPGLTKLIDLAISGKLGHVVITHKDRLCRFGYELVERLITDYSNGKIIVLNHKDTSPEEELSNDIISIITVFSARLNDTKNKKRIAENDEL